ncbi:MAG: stage III sporulation protein AF [Firmicutes bacterium]|nr:stage III sporulation protein AF [Bacillota bacterium]
METVTNLVRNLSLLLLAAAFVELLIPKGHLSSLIRLVLGLFLLAALLSPLLRFFEQELEIEKWAEELLPALGTQEDYAGQGRELAAALEQKTVEDYLDRMEQQISELARGQSGVGGVEVFAELDGEGRPERLELYFWDTSPSAAEACLRNLSGQLSLAEEKIVYQILSGEVADEGEREIRKMGKTE